MSTGNRFPLADARALAEQIVFDLQPYCQKIEIAGSIRRESETVGDIEIVAQPILTERTDMFGHPAGFHNEFDQLPFSWSRYGRVLAGGERQKKIMLPAGIQLDLYILLPPAQWGAIFLIRTGPAEFSHWIMKKRSRGGAQPDWMKQKNGALWADLELIPTPTEKAYFAALGLDFIPPGERSLFTLAKTPTVTSL